MNWSIRRANLCDAEAISALIGAAASAFLLRAEGTGAEEFFYTIQPAAIRGYLASGRHVYFVALIDTQILGAIAIRDNSHLFHLFVAPEIQRKGIAERLWSTALAEARLAGNRGVFTVNSSPLAVPVYRTFGFAVAGERVETHGIAFIPMRLCEGSAEQQ